MSYNIKEVTLRTDNTPEGIEKIEALWKDIMEGTLPLLCDNQHQMLEEILPISCYSNYASDETGEYDLSIMGVTTAFFQEMEDKVVANAYRKYETADEDMTICTRKAWEQVWEETKSQHLLRSYTKDYESSMPAAFSNDGKAHCTLYIAIK